MKSLILIFIAVAISISCSKKDKEKEKVEISEKKKQSSFIVEVPNNAIEANIKITLPEKSKEVQKIKNFIQDIPSLTRTTGDALKNRKAASINDVKEKPVCLLPDFISSTRIYPLEESLGIKRPAPATLLEGERYHLFVKSQTIGNPDEHPDSELSKTCGTTSSCTPLGSDLVSMDNNLFVSKFKSVESCPLQDRALTSEWMFQLSSNCKDAHITAQDNRGNVYIQITQSFYNTKEKGDKFACKLTARGKAMKSFTSVNDYELELIEKEVYFFSNKKNSHSPQIDNFKVQGEILKMNEPLIFNGNKENENLIGTLKVGVMGPSGQLNLIPPYCGKLDGKCISIIPDGINLDKGDWLYSKNQSSFLGTVYFLDYLNSGIASLIASFENKEGQIIQRKFIINLEPN